MSLDKFFAGIRFRTATPDFEEGDTFEAYVTGHHGNQSVRARVGDTVLRVDGVDPALVDSLVRLRVTSFDAGAHEGTAELVEVVADPE